MDISTVFIGTAVLSGTACILGLAISFVTQIFHVEIDPRIDQLHDILPHFNCGACGHPGCMPYAEAIINDNEKTDRCKPGGAKVAAQILALLESSESDLNNDKTLETSKSDK